MSVDHTPFVEDESESLLELPGFPYLRIEPILLLGNYDDIDELLRSEQEELLFAVHGYDHDLLVASNHRVRIFKIPQPKGFIRRSVGFLVDIAIPAEIGDAIDTVKDVAGAANSFKNWVSPQQRRQRAENEATNMPNPKDFKDVTWETEDPETLILISCYKERILLENSFNWKVRFEEKWRDEKSACCAILFCDEMGIVFTFEDRQGNHSFEEPFFCDTDPVIEVVKFTAEMNSRLIQNSGWTIAQKEDEDEVSVALVRKNYQDFIGGSQIRMSGPG